MKIRVDYTIDVPDHVRRAIRNYYNEEGLATREEVRHWYKRHGESMDMDIVLQLANDEQDD